jgi:predicted nuclease of predicted toxin-antitoxin system
MAERDANDLFEDIEVLDGERTFDFDCVILDADFARKAIERGELPMFVDQALKSMELSGKTIAVLKESD